MDEGAGELDEALEEIPVRPAPIRQPKFLQHVMRFVEPAAIETLEVTDVVRVEWSPAAAFE
jgi:hypothetical protein